MPTEDVELMMDGIIPPEDPTAVQGTLFPDLPEPQDGVVDGVAMANDVVVEDPQETENTL